MRLMDCACTSASGSILAPANLGAFVSAIDRAGDPHEPLRRDQLAGRLEQIGKHDHFHRPL